MENKLTEEPILRRAYLFLENGDWESAYAYADKALDASPENYKAYVCKLLCELSINSEALLERASVDFSTSTNYKNAVKFADKEQLAFLQHALDCAKKNQATRLAAQAKINEREGKIFALQNKIEEEEQSIDKCYNWKWENAEIKKTKILGGLYLLFFLIFVGSFVFLGFDLFIPMDICLSLGLVGLWTLHSVTCYVDETTGSKFYAFGFGLLNLWTIGIWGLVKSIKKLAKKRKGSNNEIDEWIRMHNENIDAYKKEIDALNKS